MNKTKIALTIGHDENNQGAYGSEGISEYEFNDELIFSLDLVGIKHTIFYRNEKIIGYSAQMTDLHSRIDEWGADISIEFHFNSFSNQAVHGHEVLYCSSGGQHIAELLNDAYDRHLPTSNRGIKKVSMSDKGGGFCCRGKSLAIIAEPFFSAHQFRFVEGGDLRESLKYAITEFLSQL